MADNQFLDTPNASKPKDGKRDKELFDYAKALYDEGRARRRHWEGIWWENIAAYMGDFWVQWDVHRRLLREPPKADYKVRVPINLIQPVVRTELAKLTKNRPIIDVLARSADQEDLNAAKVGDKMLNNYAERQFHMARVRKRMLQWVLMCGQGGILVDWDPTAMGEIDVLHDNEGNPIFDPRLIEQYKAKYEEEEKKPTYKKIPQGEMIVKDVSPFQLVFDFSTNFFEDAMWCIYSDTMDINEVYRRWGKWVEEDNDSRPGIVEHRLMGRFDLTNKLIDQRPQKAQRLATIHQMWIKPGHTKFPDGLCLVFNKDGIIFESAYEYGHGDLPIHLMNHIDLPVSQNAMSVIQALRPPNLEISKTQSQLIENRNLMANPPWLIAKQLQITTEIQNRPGLRIEFNYMPNVPEPKPVEMPEMPKYVTEMLEALKEDIREISGQGETSKGEVPPGARSGVALAYLQEEDDTRLGPTVQSFEEVMEGVAYQQLRMFAEKYDVPRIVTFYKVHGDPEVFDFLGTMLDGAAGAVCKSGSSLPRSKAAKQQFILDLWDRKLEQDPRKVREMLELSEGEPDEWEVDLDQAERENHELKQGEDPGVEEWYNHPAHHYMHRNFMKSADFKELSEQVRELFKKHDNEHTEAERAQAAELAANQAAQPQPGGGGGGEPPPGGSSAPAGANGQTQVQGPPSQFTSATSPASLMQGGAQ